MNTNVLKTSKIYKQAGKCDKQQQLKDIIEAAMVSTPEGFTYNIPIYPMKSTPVKKPRAQKSLCRFTNILAVKKKTATRWIGAAKSKQNPLNFVINHGHWDKSEKENWKLMNR